MPRSLRTHTFRWSSCLAIGVLIGTSAVAHAQRNAVKTDTVKAADLLGSWDYEAPPEKKASWVSVLHRSMTFRQDGTWLEVLTRRYNADTLACANLQKWTLVPSGDSITWKSPFDTTNWSQTDWLTMKDGQLSLRVYGEQKFKRVPSLTGITDDHLAPMPANTATGKLADLVGTWEELPDQGSWMLAYTSANQAALHAALASNTLTIRPDLTFVDAKTWKDGTGTASCKEGGRWKQQKISGDTVSLSDDWGAENKDVNNLRYFIIQGDQMSIVWPKSDKPYAVYKRAPKKP